MAGLTVYHDHESEGAVYYHVAVRKRRHPDAFRIVSERRLTFEEATCIARDLVRAYRDSPPVTPMSTSVLILREVESIDISHTRRRREPSN